jgi:DNA-binding MarR family transcriptional regulator
MRPTPEECVREVLDVVPYVMRILRAEFRSHRGEDLSIPQYRTLMFLRRTPGASLSAVAEHLGMTAPSTSRWVQDLVERGLIDRHPSAADRRRIELMLTHQGRERAEESLRKTQTAYLGRFATLPPEKLASIVATMHDLKILFNQEE